MFTGIIILTTNYKYHVVALYYSLRLYMRIMAVFKISTCLYVVPYCTFTGSIIGLFYKYIKKDHYEPIKNIDNLCEPNLNEASELQNRIRIAKIVINANKEYKIRFLMKFYAALCFITAILDTEHSLGRYLEYLVCCLCVCSCTMGTLCHYIFFPGLGDFGIVDDNFQSATVPLHTQIHRITAIYLAIVFGCVSIGGYYTLLNWFQPIVKFPMPIYAGINIGHFLASIVSYIVLYVYS
ncbi:hypothetical protein BdWA1_000786 [Babesia duncani]|uniref:Uncharacterized protein n=1 Tax=Babesia duncani TaxID=323732 RepID=A0AAD9UQ43_9APIC|nr:hypothetical protein BdWA1_000786 [Babesia duncani]